MATAMAPTISAPPNGAYGTQFQMPLALVGNAVNSSIQNPMTGKLLEPTPVWQLEMVMEKLRGCSTKSWTDSTRNAKLALSVEKKLVLDTNEKVQLQKCLDSIQKSLKVSSLADMIERLESISRQLNLKFQASNANSTDCIISSEMFLIEISMDLKAVVEDVKIAHHSDSEPRSCPEMVSLLNKGDFASLSNHLEGLLSIYLLVGEKKLKSKAWVALSSLESDLGQLAQLQNAIADTSNLVHKSPVGVVQFRKGGIPMRLTYFISPYDLLDETKGGLIPLTVETITSSNLGHCVNVTIQPSIGHKLQTLSLISVSRSSDGKSLPSFSALSPSNSVTLPAVFSLQLPTPIPVSVNIVRQVQQVTGIDCADLSDPSPLLSLIIKSASDNHLDCQNNKGLFVTLPDQQHCYFLTSPSDQQGVMLSTIPFTHPTHVPQVLVLLRQQVLFNTLINSCVRLKSRHDLESAITFEVSAFSIQHLSVMFEHPAEDSMATIEFDLADISNIRCRLFTVSHESTFCSEDYASKVIQRCLSIPVTMRAVIKKTQTKKQSICHQGNADVMVSLGQFPPTDQNQNSKVVPDLEGGQPTIKTEPQSCVLNSNTSYQVYNVAPGNSTQHCADKLPSSLEALMQAGGEAPATVLLSLMNEQVKQKKMRKRKSCELLSGDSPVSSPGQQDSEEDDQQDTSSLVLNMNTKLQDINSVIKKEKTELTEMSPSPATTSIPSEHYFLGEGLSKGSEGEVLPCIGLGSDSLDIEPIESTFLPLGLSVIPTKTYVGSGLIDKRDKKLPKLRLDHSSLSMLSDNQQGSPVLVEFSDKSSLSALSITPVTSSPSQSHQFEHNPINPSFLGLGLEKRPGIEIIPLPGNGPDDYYDDKKKEFERLKKEGRRLDDVDKRREGKKKRKREDNMMSEKPCKIPNISIASTNMGPPLHLMARAFEKTSVPKPLTISLKSQGSTSPVYNPKHEGLVVRPGSRPTTPSPTPSLSPKQGSSIISGNVGVNTSSRTSASSPKNSKPYSISSPKGGVTVTKSVSPKLPQSSGKPSLSTLKSTSPSLIKTASPPKHKSKKGGTADRISSQSVGSKVKGTTGGGISGGVRSGSESPVHGTGPASPETSLKHGAQNQTQGQCPVAPNKSPVRNRKGSLSAVIDKLRLGQHPEPSGCSERPRETKKDKRSPDRGGMVPVSRDKVSGDSKKAEFIVKPSSQGLKLTVTKTKSTDGTTKLTSSVKTSFSKERVGSKSPVPPVKGGSTTGLKAGVTSGPASKKVNLGKAGDGGVPGFAHSKAGGLFSNSSVRVKPSSPKLSGETRIKDKTKADKVKSLKQASTAKDDKNKLETDAEKTVTKLLQSWTDPSGEQRALAKYKIPKLEPKPDGENTKTVKGEGPKPGTIIVRSDPNKKTDLQDKIEDKTKATDRIKMSTPVGISQPGVIPRTTNLVQGTSSAITSPKSGGRPLSPKQATNTSTPFKTINSSVTCTLRNDMKVDRSLPQAAHANQIGSQPLNLTIHHLPDDTYVPDNTDNSDACQTEPIRKSLPELGEAVTSAGNTSLAPKDVTMEEKLVPKSYPCYSSSLSAKPILSCNDTSVNVTCVNNLNRTIKTTAVMSPESPDSCADEEGLVIDVENSISLSDDASPKQGSNGTTVVSVPPRPSSRPSSQPPLGYQSVMSPSVSVHIVKSPAPVQSPLTLVSPRSAQASPFVIDDDLMDEALMLSK